MVDFDYVIVGAGAAGCVLASRLSEDPGNQVLLLELRGAGGPLGVSVVENHDELVQALLASAQDMGWEHVADTNAHDSERVGFTPATIRHGVRTSAYSAFVRPIRSRRNLTVATRTRAGYLLFDGSRVVGVRAANGGRTVNFLGYQIRPATTGSVHLSGRLPGNPPVISARFLDDDADRRATAPVLGIVRQLFGKGPLADLVLDEDFPGPAVSSPDEVVRYALDTGAGIYHAVGASAMGPDASDVVDPQLRVRGVTGLRVVDASVLPVQVAGNTQAPAMAVAWIAADLIREDS